MSNSLSKVHPELVPEWSEKNLPLTPETITFGSNKKVWWKAACGHEWQTSVKARSNGESCPICSGARVIAGINDLATIEPLLAKEWSEKNDIQPTEVSIGSHKKVILVKRGIGDSVAICQCVAQELAHAQLAVTSEAYSRKDCGFDAVCIGYMLCKKYGVDAQNFNIANLDNFKNKEPKEIRSELNKVRGAMNEIHSRVSDEMYRKSQEKSKDRDAR